MTCRAILNLPSQILMCGCAECVKLPESSLRTFLCQVSQLRSLDLSGVPSARTEVLLEVSLPCHAWSDPGQTCSCQQASCQGQQAVWYCSRIRF